MKKERLKQIGILLILCMALLSITLLGRHLNQGSKEQVEVHETIQHTETANPWTDHTTLKEAEDAAYVDFGIPENIHGADARIFRSMEGMIEVIYQDASGEEVCRLRKSDDLNTADISGDYNEYDSNISVEITVGETDPIIVSANLRGSAETVNVINLKSHSAIYAFVAGTFEPTIEEAAEIIELIVNANSDENWTQPKINIIE